MRLSQLIGSARERSACDFAKTKSSIRHAISPSAASVGFADQWLISSLACEEINGGNLTDVIPEKSLPTLRPRPLIVRRTRDTVRSETSIPRFLQFAMNARCAPQGVRQCRGPNQRPDLRDRLAQYRRKRSRCQRTMRSRTSGPGEPVGAAFAFAYRRQSAAEGQDFPAQLRGDLFRTAKSNENKPQQNVKHVARLFLLVR